MSASLDSIVEIIIKKPIKFGFFYFILQGLISVTFGAICMASYLIVNPGAIGLNFLVFLIIIVCGLLNIYKSKQFSKAHSVLHQTPANNTQRDENLKNLIKIRRAFNFIFAASLILTILLAVWILWIYYNISINRYVFEFMIAFFISSLLGVFLTLSYTFELHELTNLASPP